MAVEGISSVLASEMAGPAASATPPAAAPGFGELLTSAVERVNGEQMEARGALERLATGEELDLHGTMIALEEAEISLRAMASVRDKLIGAYEQVMNMAM